LQPSSRINHKKIGQEKQNVTIGTGLSLAAGRSARADRAAAGPGTETAEPAKIAADERKLLSSPAGNLLPMPAHRVAQFVTGLRNQASGPELSACSATVCDGHLTMHPQEQFFTEEARRYAAECRRLARLARATPPQRPVLVATTRWVPNAMRSGGDVSRDAAGHGGQNSRTARRPRPTLGPTLAARRTVA
jgi:hypothetical protein